MSLLSTLRSPGQVLHRLARRCVLCFLLLIGGMNARAGHYAGGSITWECVGAGQYEIHLDLFLDCSGFTIIPQDITFSSDCGTTFTVQDLLPVSQTEVSQLCAAELVNSTCNGGALPGIMWYHFETVQNLPPCDSWNVSWNICCRSNALNLVGAQGMYIDAEINTLDAACDDSPVFTDQSLPYVCVNQPVYYNFGITDPDGDALAYSLVSGQLFAGTVQNLNYQAGFTGGIPVAGITVDPITGQIVFTPTAIGNYVVVIQVEEYDTNGQLIGVVMRDITFVVIACTGDVPETQGVVNNTGGILTGPNSIEVCDGEAFCLDVVFTDTDPGTVLQVVSQATALLPGASFIVSGTNPATARICWTGDLSNTPVNVLIQADDGSCPIENTASIAVNITTVATGGPAPMPGTSGSVQVCPGSAAFFLIDVLGGTPDANGYWLDPNGDPHNADFDPITDPAGVYTYTVGTACASATATATVTYVPAPDAGSDAVLAVCADVAPVDLLSALGGTPDAGGTWTTPGGGAFGGVYDPALHGPGAYTYTVPAANGCASTNASVTVSESVAPVPGTSGVAVFCDNAPPQNLLGSLGGSPQAGGTWTAPGGGAFSGGYDPSVHAPGVYTYTVTGTVPCIDASATVTVTEHALPTAGTSGAITVCTNDLSFNLPGLLGGSPGAGGAWTAPGGGPHSATYDPAIDVPGVYTYMVTGTAPCPNAAATVTVSENLAPNAGSNGTLSVCSDGASGNLFDQLAGAQSNGTWTGPGGAPSLGGYTPTVDSPGIFTYTVTGMAPCLSDQATVTVTESVPPNAGADGALSICGNNFATNLGTLLAGAQGGGTWTAPDGSPFSGTYDPSVHAGGVYIYTVAGIAPCPSNTATVTVSENIPPVAGADAALTVCSTSPGTALFPLLAGAGPAGQWIGPGGTPFSGTYDPAMHGPGQYTYLVSGTPPCAADQAIVTVNENLAPAAGVDAFVAFCDDSAPTGLLPLLLGAQAGGVWSAPGGGAFGGIYDPALHGPGVYTYALTGAAPCADDQATVTVAENIAPEAGTSSTLTVCGNSGVSDLFVLLAGADPGGAWTAPGGGAFSGGYDPPMDVPGVYTYTVAGILPCAAVQATVTVTENSFPVAGADGVLVTCSSSTPSALPGLLTGAQPGGTWTAPGGGAFPGTYDPAIHASGVYTYTVIGIAPCGSDQAIISVTENLLPNAGTDGSLAVCGNSPPAALFAQLTGADVGGNWTSPGGGVFNGTYDPALASPGVYQYTVDGTAPCPSDQASVTVTESPVPTAGTDGTLTICGSAAPAALFPLLTGAQAGGAWAAPGGGVFSGVYDPALNVPGVYTYTVPGSAPCVSDVATVTVTEDPPNAAAISYPSAAFCATSASVNVVLNGTAGGVFSAAAGLLLDAGTGSIAPSTSAPGPYTVSYTLPANGTCPAMVATAGVTIVAPVNAGTDAVVTVCDVGGAVDLFDELAGAQGAGTWTAPGGGAFMGSYDPLVHASGVYMYTLSGTAPCPGDQSTVTVNETGAPDAGTDGSLTLCTTSAPTGLLIALGGSAQVGGAWSEPGGGSHSGTIDPATDAAGIYTYTLTATAPCVSDQSQVTVTMNAAPQAGSDGALTVCDVGAPVGLFGQLTGAQSGGQWTDAGGLAFSGIYDPANDASGSFTYTINGIAPCPADQAVVVVNETGTPDAGSDGSLTICSAAGPLALFPSLTGAQPGGGWTGPGGGAHSGTFDPAVDPAGAYAYTLVATAPCLSDLSQVTVTVESAPQAGTDASVTVCDQGAPVVLFAQLAGADPGGTWTAPGGGVFTGTYDPTSDTGGIYTYSVGGAGVCPADASIVTVTETGSPSAGTDGILTLCGNGPAALLPDALSGSPMPGGSWTAPGGVPHGPAIDPVTDPGGIYTYTIAGTPPCAGDQSQVTVVINAAANAGADGGEAVCEAGGPVDLTGALTGAQSGGDWSAPGGAAFSGIYDPTVDDGGVYTYTVQGIAPCTADQALITVAESGSPFAGADASLDLCSTSLGSDLFAVLTGAQTGGDWSGPGGGPHSGIMDPSTDPSGIYVYTLTAAAPCMGDAAQVTVGIIPAANAGVDAGFAVCDQMVPVDLLVALTGEDPGGSWAAPGGGAFSGVYDPSVDVPGVYTYAVDGMAPCGAEQSTVTVTETSSPFAGPDGATTLCANSPASDLFAVLTGADAGGTWTDPNGFAHDGSMDPSMDVAGAYTYTLSALAPCAGDQSQVQVAVETAPDAGMDGSITVCDQGVAIDLFTQLVGADAGGSWTGPGGFGSNGSYDPLNDVPGVYLYTVSGTLPCAADQAVVNVTETGSPNAGVDAALEICTSTGPTALLGLLGPDALAGGSWTAPDGSAHSGTLVPALDVSGIYMYTIAGTAPCGSSNASITVEIESAPNAGIDGSFTVCTGDAEFSLFAVLGGTPDSEGAWTDILNAPFDGQFDPAVSPQGMYTYTVNSPICGADLATVEIIVVLGPNAGQDNTLSVCETDAPLSLFTQLLGQPANNGNWTGPDGLYFNGTLDPSMAQSGEYTYTVPTFGGGCPDAHAVITATISSTVDAGSVNNVSLCSTNSSLVLLGQLSGNPDAGGSWVDPLGQAFSGTFDPATGLAGVYTYTVMAQAPCPSASASLNVEVNQQPVAGDDTALALCSSDAPLALFSLIGGPVDPGGVWTAPDGSPFNGQFAPGISLPGTYVYLLEGTSPCIDDQSTITISLSQAANMGADGGISVCADDDDFGLFPLLGAGTDTGGLWTTPDGQPSNGTIDPSTATGGSYTYTLAAPAPCQAVQGSVFIVINAVPAPSIAVSMADGCAPVEVTFTDAADAQGEHVWSFGNGDTSHTTAPDPVLYDEEGNYTITLTVTSDAGCNGEATLVEGLHVYTRPVAAFLAGPPNLNTGAPEAYFHNQSIGAAFVEWSFADLGTSSEVSPHFTFPSQLEGVYTVCLTAFASDNCYDTACVEIPVPAGAGLFVPNAFTPDGDGINDVFTPFVAGVKEQGYRFLIVDRWGQELFSTERMGMGWDGNYGNGDAVPIGVYVWKLIGRERYGSGRVDHTGHVTLVR